MPDQERFLELYLPTEGDIKAFVRTLVRDRRDFEDISQSVVLVLWRKFDQYDPDRPFGAWARGIAAKEVLAMRRREGRQPIAFSPDVVATILDSFERRTSAGTDVSDRLDALDHCLDTLPGDSRQLIDLRYSDSLSIHDVAAQAERSEASTQKAISRIRQKLADCIHRRLSNERRQEP